MIQKWVIGIEQLVAIATSFPHSAYAGLISCLSAKWQYICRTVPDVGPCLALFLALIDPSTTNSEHSSDRMSGLIMSPSDMDGASPTSLTNVTAAAQASG
ncbi:hypothetical protein ACHAW6_015415 [Cyclotella cf. meneghiniana]